LRWLYAECLLLYDGSCFKRVACPRYSEFSLSRSNQQLVRLVQELIRQVRSGRLSMRWLAGLVALAVAYLLLQPVLERTLGVDLPGFGDLGGMVATEPAVDTPSPNSREAPADGELERLLQASRPGTYQSPAGLRYRRGSQHGHRLKHLMAHAKDQPDRPGQHGVFDSAVPSSVVALVDEAYQQALAGKNTRERHEDDRTIYTVNLGRRIGYIGGESGNRRGQPAARHLRLVLEGKNFVTAFPYRP